MQFGPPSLPLTAPAPDLRRDARLQRTDSASEIILDELGAADFNERETTHSIRARRGS